jgi:hypothetical protein
MLRPHSQVHQSLPPAASPTVQPQEPAHLTQLSVPPEPAPWDFLAAETFPLSRPYPCLSGSHWSCSHRARACPGESVPRLPLDLMAQDPGGGLHYLMAPIVTAFPFAQGHSSLVPSVGPELGWGEEDSRLQVSSPASPPLLYCPFKEGLSDVPRSPPHRGRPSHPLIQCLWRRAVHCRTPVASSWVWTVCVSQHGAELGRPPDVKQG